MDHDQSTEPAAAESPAPRGSRRLIRRLPRRLLAAGAAAAIATGGVAGGWAAHGLTDHSDAAPTRWQAAPGAAGGTSGSLDVTSASSTQATGLVRIVAVSPYNGSTAAGTGMVLTPSGEVVTNNHVVEGSTRIRATVVATGRTYPARLVATDKRDDVAVLQLRGATGLTPVTTDASGARRGDSVTAVGDAGGSDTLSAAPGKVSALRRSITTSDSGGAAGEHLRGLIEVDADVVSGDSGGALLDEDGHVVGMTTAASSGTTNITGYAIPVAKVLRIAGRAEAGAATARLHLGYDGFLGIELATGSTSPTVAGVLAGTPAAGAGITTGARITSVDGRTVSTAGQLHRLLTAHRPGDVVRVAWRNVGGAHSASVRLARGPAA